MALWNPSYILISLFVHNAGSQGSEMAKIEPSKPRAQISDERGSLRVVIPTKKNWFLILFMGFWLCMWAVGEVMVPQLAFKKGLPPSALLFMIAWLGGWTVGGGFATYAWLWNLTGKEVILVNSQLLTTRREMGQFGRTKEFILTQIRDLRASQPIFNPADFSSGLQFWGLGGGTIAFDYGAKTYRFGSGLDEAEAKQIVNTIKNRFKIQDTDRK